ncbi:response regulator [Chroococcus sp. FPU101]|uniref:response regulator n=1 Tax=Chroococcus sp. FPU101 TaxID=1974212 RepID=UPI001A8FAED2|nr:response regulator [Chroococcus sp. FPU101]GFE70097.1 multi-sensor hybrid histidine kinase [Chroococcus sp. FPU101]
MSQESLTILLINENQIARQTYCKYLQDDKYHTYTILEASSRKQALSICSEQFPDAIILDYDLELDGLEILNELRSLRGTHDLPVVRLADQRNEEIAAATIKGEASDYLIKSKTTAETLRQAILRTIKREQLNRQQERDVSARRQAETALQQQLIRQRLVMDMLERIRQSLQLDEILNTTAREVRQFLNTDRVLIFRFNPDWSGQVAVESVGEQWLSIRETLIHDPCFNKPQEGASYVERYRRGRVQAISDIYTAGLEPCHVELLAQFQVKANLIVPILQRDNLWGLLVAHHCQSPRQWLEEEIKWLQQLAMQVGIAIQQSCLYEQLQDELVERQQIEEELRQARDFLEKRVTQRTVQLASANQELLSTLDELQVTQEELRQQNEALLAARELAEAESQRYQDLFSEAPDGYLVTDIYGKIREANRAAATLLGVPQTRLVGKPLAVFIAASDRDTFRMRLTRLQAVQNWEMCLHPRSRSPFYAVLAMTCMKNPQGQPVGLRWLLRDISERKNAERQIQQQAALIDIASDAIFVCDLEYRILFWSQGAERLYGWSASETLGKKTCELFYNNSATETEPDLNTVIEKSIWYGELEQLTLERQRIIVESRWTLVRNETGAPQSILVVNTNITEKKHLEIQFYRAQRLESLGTLASGIAHDLNNILQPILFIAHLLRQKFPLLDTQTQERLMMLEDSSRRGASLVAQILSFACGDGEEGKRSYVQIKHLLKETIQVAQKTFPKLIRIQLNYPKQELWTVHADATQLHQVFMNLIVNARDAMPEGGNLTITAENFLLDETYARMELEAHSGLYVSIAIADTGTGIAPEIKERIFDPFFTTKEQGKGTGLGLSTVLGIVKNHGGFVQVKSVLNQGSEFKVYLPAVETQVSEPTDFIELSDGNGQMILIVDDESLIREIAQSALEEHNYRTLTANDGIEAIALYAQYQHEIDVVLIDLMMPEMDGITAIRALQKINPQLKFIVTSGLASSSKLNNITDLGVSTFLAKPYTETELLKALRSLFVT